MVGGSVGPWLSGGWTVGKWSVGFKTDEEYITKLISMMKDYHQKQLIFDILIILTNSVCKINKSFYSQEKCR